jgi:hypothetical protein
MMLGRCAHREHVDETERPTTRLRQPYEMNHFVPR